MATENFECLTDNYGVFILMARLIKILWIHYCGIHVGEDLELVGHAQVIAIRRQPVGDHALPYLLLGEGVNHVVFFGHLANPAVALKHATPLNKEIG